MEVETSIVQIRCVSLVTADDPISATFGRAKKSPIFGWRREKDTRSREDDDSVEKICV